VTRASFSRWAGYAALGLALYLLCLLVFAPADYFARGVTRLTRGALIIQQPAGTLWHGNGALVVASTSPQPLGQIRWRLQPWKILTGSIGAEFQLDGPDIDARAAVDVGLRRHVLRDVVAQAPASSVMQFFPAAQTMGLGGRLRLTATEVEIGKDVLNGSAELSWENAASPLLPVKSAGDYTVQLRGEGKQLGLMVATTRGALQVAAQGAWKLFEDGALELQGSLATTTPALEEFVRAIGPAQSDGRHGFAYTWRGRPVQTAALFPL